MPQRRTASRNEREGLIEADISDEEEFEEHRSIIEETKWNLAAFWLLGLCNNFAYVIMLSAAKDILETGDTPAQNHTIPVCREHIYTRSCHPLSTGSVLLADIIPSFLIKITAPFYIHYFPFGMRHVIVVALQAGSFILVALSTSVPMGLTGVALASFGSGLGEITYLSLTHHFNVKTISFWSSGTGGAGIFGALIYALFTDKQFLAITPRNTLISMLVVPIIFTVTYFSILQLPHTVYRIRLCHPKSYIVPPGHSASSRDLRRSSDDAVTPLLSPPGSNDPSRLQHVATLIKFIIPLVLVYFGEYFINQGLTELLEFDCSHGLNLDPASQYRWYQVLYQLGVFISRSSSDFYAIKSSLLPLVAILQLFNAGMFLIDAIEYFIPHITMVFLLILYEGLLGGAAYVNTFRAIHTEVTPEMREFSMGVVSISDTLGIVLSGIVAIPVHNWICSKPL